MTHLTVAQVGRSCNSITVRVSGITEGDRETSVYVPAAGERLTLQQAKEYGFVSDFYVADLSANNGSITIEIADRYLSCKVIKVYVKNINTSTGDKTVLLPAVLDFEYENGFPKVTGGEIDITVLDMKEINLFGMYLDLWIGGSDETFYYTLDGVSKGDDIYYEYLALPAQNILNAAFFAYNDYSMPSDNYDAVTVYATDIKEGCAAGADFKAQYFNDIMYAITRFNLSVSA